MFEINVCTIEQYDSMNSMSELLDMIENLIQGKAIVSSLSFHV